MPIIPVPSFLSVTERLAMCYVTVQTCIIIAIISLLMLILRLISCKLISSLSRFHNNLTPDNGASLHMPNIPNVNVETSRTLVQKSAPNPPESSPTSSPTSPFINIFIGGNVNEHTEQKYILNLQIVFKGFLICVCVGGVFMLGSLGYNFWLLKNNKAPTFPPVGSLNLSLNIYRNFNLRKNVQKLTRKKSSKNS